eukprot:1586321-Pleurochrysis_carterae.AAC.1
MRPTSLRAVAAIANSSNMKMRRWDFGAAYLQGSLERDEVVYCHAPPGYATLLEGVGSARYFRGCWSLVLLNAIRIHVSLR